MRNILKKKRCEITWPKALILTGSWFLLTSVVEAILMTVLFSSHTLWRIYCMGDRGVDFLPYVIIGAWIIVLGHFIAMIIAGLIHRSWKIVFLLYRDTYFNRDCAFPMDICWNWQHDGGMIQGLTQRSCGVWGQNSCFKYFTSVIRNSRLHIANTPIDHPRRANEPVVFPILRIETMLSTKPQRAKIEATRRPPEPYISESIPPIPFRGVSMSHKE